MLHILNASQTILPTDEEEKLKHAKHTLTHTHTNEKDKTYNMYNDTDEEQQRKHIRW